MVLYRVSKVYTLLSPLKRAWAWKSVHNSTLKCLSSHHGAMACMILSCEEINVTINERQMKEKGHPDSHSFLFIKDHDFSSEHLPINSNKTPINRNTAEEWSNKTDSGLVHP